LSWGLGEAKSGRAGREFSVQDGEFYVRGSVSAFGVRFGGKALGCAEGGVAFPLASSV
jgi:hypothetical protein